MRGIAKMVSPPIPSNPCVQVVIHTVRATVYIALVRVRLALWILFRNPAAVVFRDHSQRPQLQSSAGAVIIVVVVVVVVTAAACAVLIAAVIIAAVANNTVSADRCSGGLLYTVVLLLYTL